MRPRALSMKKEPPVLPCAVVPLAFCAAAAWLASARGPFWLAANLDPDYVYLLNGLLLACGRPPAVVHHPGTLPEALVAAVLRLMHPASASSSPVAAGVG